jgi:hypothetical protein
MDLHGLHTLHLFRGGPTRPDGLSLAACSICLRVQQGSDWIESGELIRRMRTFELEAVPWLRPGLCDRCSESIRARRQQLDEPFAA